MAVRADEVEGVVRVPSQRTTPTVESRPVVLSTSRGDVVAVRAPRVLPTTPATADVALGVATLTLRTARSAVDLGRLAGLVALDRLPVPALARRRARQLWQSAGALGMRRREELRGVVAALLDAAVPLLARELLSRVDVARLVGEYVDVDRIVTGVDIDAVADRLDLDRAADRLDLDRIIDRIDLDEIAARLDLDRVLDRVDLDELVSRVDLDRVVDRVDLDRAAARIDLDPLLERADVVGLARYVVDAIDLPAIIRASTGTMTSDMVRGVRAQSADADEAVARVVDRLLRRRGGRKDLAPGAEP